MKNPNESHNSLRARRLTISSILHAFCALDSLVNYLGYNRFFYPDSGDHIPTEKRKYLYREDAQRFYHELPGRLDKFNLSVAPEKTKMVRFSRFHPGKERRIIFLGFETYWMEDSGGDAKVKQRTSRKKLQGACRRIKEWIKENRHLRGRTFIEALNRRLRGHYNYYNIPGNLESIWRFYFWAVECSFKWLNHRGGKRRSFSWKTFNNAIDRLGIAKPKMQIVNRQHRVFA